MACKSSPNKIQYQQWTQGFSRAHHSISWECLGDACIMCVLCAFGYRLFCWKLKIIKNIYIFWLLFINEFTVHWPDYTIHVPWTVQQALDLKKKKEKKKPKNATTLNADANAHYPNGALMCDIKVMCVRVSLFIFIFLFFRSRHKPLASKVWLVTYI